MCWRYTEILTGRERLESYIFRDFCVYYYYSTVGIRVYSN